MRWRKIKENISLFFYPFQQQLTWISKIIQAFLISAVLISLVYYHGYPQSEKSRNLLFLGISLAFTYYIFSYFLQFLTSNHWIDFLKKRWFESILVFLLIIEGINHQFFGGSLPVRLLSKEDQTAFSDFTLLVVQVYFLILMFSRSFYGIPNYLPFFRIHPVLLFVIAFILMIILGTFLLMLPEMSVLKEGLPFFEALFMAVSAACVTGLSVIDLAQILTVKGQMVLLFLMKLGGINVVAFGSFIALVARFGIGVQQHPVIQDLMMRDNLVSSRGMLKKVLIWGSTIELMGAVALFFVQDEMLYQSLSERIFNAVFHAVSAFNNAGFSIFDNGFFHEGVRFNYPFLMVISLLIFAGSLSFIALFDIFTFSHIKERIDKPWKRFEFSTRVALYFSLILVLFGTIFFFFLEQHHALRHHTYMGKWVTAFFHSMTTRTAGFSTIPMIDISLSMLFIFLLLMLIGACSGSTGGGVKVSSFALLYAAFFSSLKGYPNAVLFKRTMSKDLIYRAFSAFFLFIACIFCFTFLLTLTENQALNAGEFAFFDLLFEEFSAFNTVGLSTGITNELSIYGQIILILSMFLGRTGTILIAFMVTHKNAAEHSSYPTAHIIVG